MDTTENMANMAALVDVGKQSRKMSAQTSALLMKVKVLSKAVKASETSAAGPPKREASEGVVDAFASSASHFAMLADNARGNRRIPAKRETHISSKDMTEEQLDELVKVSHNRGHGHNNGKKAPMCIDWVILPDSTFRRTWDGFIAIFVMYLIWKIPFDLAFYAPLVLKSDAAKIWDIFLDVYFVVDIVLNFRTGFYHGKHLVINQREIVSHYAKSWLIIDVFASIPFDLIVENMSKSERKSIKMLKLFKLSKLLRVARIVKYMRHFIKYRHIITFFGGLIVALHGFTCLWFAVEESYDPMRYNLMYKNKFGSGPIYMEVLDQTIMHMFGDAPFFDTAVTQGAYEYFTYGEGYKLNGNKTDYAGMEAQIDAAGSMHFLSIFVRLFGVLITACLVGAVVNIMSGLDASRERFQAKMEALKTSMGKMDLPDDLQQRVSAYYDYLWMEHKADETQNVFYDPDLNDGLRTEISNVITMEHLQLRRIEMLSTVSDECISRVLMIVQMPLILCPGDFAFTHDETCTNIFYVLKGDLVLYTKDDMEKASADLEGFPIEAGMFIGEKQMVAEACWDHSLVAKSFVELASIGRTDLYLVMMDFPQFAHLIDKAHKKSTKKKMFKAIGNHQKTKTPPSSEEPDSMAPAADARTKRVSLKARTLLRGEADKEAVEGEAVPQQQADDSILPGAPQAGAAASKRASGVSRAASISRGELLTPVFADNTAELLETQQELLRIVRRQQLQLTKIQTSVFQQGKQMLKLQHSVNTSNMMQM